MNLDELQRLVDGVEIEGQIDTWLWSATLVFALSRAKGCPEDRQDDLTLATRVPFVMGAILGWHAHGAGWALVNNDQSVPEPTDARLGQLDSITQQLARTAIRSDLSLPGATI